MIPLMLHGGLAALGLAVLLGLWRLARGPTVLDRIVAFDLVTVSVVGMTALLTILWRTPHYLELILIFSLLGFLGTVAFTTYLQKTLDRHGDPGDHEP
ncbi:MAG: Na(+)/H(+) antiporter subunit F [Verrucomicrobiae bacterium]|nr:Na(+)/H(+) antiporter subunit F [Verrucomicrobiae bacterium]